METTRKIKGILEAAYDKRDEIVICLMGQPGIGKTQSIYEFAEEKGVNVVTIIASQILPNEVSGITMPDKDSKSMEIYDHAKLSSMKDGDILFFDELLQASPSTLSACLTLIQERMLMSGKKLPDIMIVAAANPLASANMVPVSIRQRFIFYNVEFSGDEWSNYMEERFGKKPDGRMLGLINFSSSSYNVVTPRTLTKLIDWAWSEKIDSDKIAFVKEVITSSFGSTTTDVIMNYVMPEETKGKGSQVREVLKEWAETHDEISDEVLDEMLKMDDKQLAKALMQSTFWASFSEAIKSIDENME